MPMNILRKFLRLLIYSKGAIPSMKAVDANKAIQDMVDHSQKWHNGTSTGYRSTETSDELDAIQAQLNNLGREIKKADRIVKCPKGIAENILVGIDKFVFPVDFIVLDMPDDIKTPLILGRPFLSTAYAKIDVFKRKIILRVGNDKIVFKKLKRNQVDDLEPTIEECKVVDEPMMDIVKTRCDNRIVDGLDEYPSYYDFDRKIHIDCAYNLQFLCMIGYKHINANFFPLLSISVMSKNIYNSIMKDKILNMDSYYDEGMGDVIVGRPFCTEACHRLPSPMRHSPIADLVT
nr:hypothetical protein [Tanacetum cinerariifolium]